MKITDVVNLLEAYGPPGSKAMGGANFKMFMDFYRGRKTAPVLYLNFGNDNIMTLSDSDVDKLANYYNELSGMPEKYEFVYSTMSRLDKFSVLAKRLGLTVPQPASQPQGDSKQLGLFERDSKKKSPDELDRHSVRDPKLAVALRQAYSKYPTAASEIEAFIRQELENQAATDQNFSAQNRTNDRQDQTLDQLRDLARKQSRQIDALDQENDSLDSELNQVSREINNMDQQLDQLDKPRAARSEPKDKKSDEPDQAATGAYTPTRGQERRASSKQRREKQRADRGDTAKPASAPVAAPQYTVPPTKITPPVLDVLPTAKKTMPAEPSVPDVSAAAASARAASQRYQQGAAATAAKMAQIPDTERTTPSEPAGDSKISHMYGIPAELPRDVASNDEMFPAKLTKDELSQQDDMFGQRRVAEDVRRMLELAGMKKA